MISYSAREIAPGKPPTRRVSNRHRKQRSSMGKFALSAAQYDTERRKDIACVAGKWITENFDEDDLAEFVRLANGHRWNYIISLSDNGLKEASMIRHVHGTCICFEDVAGRACCACDQTGRDD